MRAQKIHKTGRGGGGWSTWQQPHSISGTSWKKKKKKISDLNFKADNAGIAQYVKKRMTKNVEAIMEMSRSEISPSNYVALQSCQSTSASVERSFSMLKKLLSKDRNFLPQNVGKYLVLHYNYYK